MRSSTCPWTKNWRRRANAEHTTDSLCNFRSTPVWHSCVRICLGYAGLTCIAHHSHHGKYPSVETTTLLKGCRSLKCRQSIHPPCNHKKVTHNYPMLDRPILRCAKNSGQLNHHGPYCISRSRANHGTQWCVCHDGLEDLPPRLGHHKIT